MIGLVYGGAACGKSAFAEGIALRRPGRHLYLATMQPFGADACRRIARHRTLRRGKGFETIECYTGLGRLALPPDSVVLLECIGNLLANEMFLPDGAGKDAADAICEGMERIAEQVADLVIVSNDVGRDGIRYEAATQGYIDQIGKINCFLSQRADWVVEMVCGLPIWQKGAKV